MKTGPFTFDDAAGKSWRITGPSASCGPQYADIESDDGERSVRPVAYLGPAGLSVPHPVDCCCDDCFEPEIEDGPGDHDTGEHPGPVGPALHHSAEPHEPDCGCEDCVEWCRTDTEPPAFSTPAPLRPEDDPDMVEVEPDVWIFRDAP